MKLNEVSWNLTLTPIYLQSSEAVGEYGNALVHLMNITFVSVLLRFVNYLDSWIEASSLTLKSAASSTGGCLTKRVRQHDKSHFVFGSYFGILSARNLIQTFKCHSCLRHCCSYFSCSCLFIVYKI